MTVERWKVIAVEHGKVALGRSRYRLKNKAHSFRRVVLFLCPKIKEGMEMLIRAPTVIGVY